MDGKLTLNCTQHVLMDEWKTLSRRMHEAGIMFVIDEEYRNVYVLNGNNIEETANEYDDILLHDNDGCFVEFDDDEDAEFMEFPNLIFFSPNSDRLYFKYK